MENKKYSILTYIFGNYEFVREPLEIDEDCEYILVTDNISLKSKTWKIIYLQDVKLTNSFDKSLYVRYHPSCLENPMDRGARRVAVHGIAKSRTQPGD